MHPQAPHWFPYFADLIHTGTLSLAALNRSRFYLGLPVSPPTLPFVLAALVDLPLMNLLDAPLKKWTRR